MGPGWVVHPGETAGTVAEYTTPVRCRLYDTWVVHNTAGSGGTGGDAGGIGRAGAGGGIYSTGKLTLDGAIVEGNLAGIGGYRVSPPGTQGGPGGDGGGVYSAGGAAIAFSSVANNRAGTGQSAGTHGQAGGGGRGGGIFNIGEMLLRQSTVNDNASGDGGSGGACGAGGDGGGIVSIDGALWLANSTVSGNRTGAGGATCASGNGGGIFTNGGVTINNSTLTANRTGEGPDGDGGGILVADRSVVMRSTILAGNAAAHEGPDCKTLGVLPAVVELRGANLVQQTAGCTWVEAPYVEPNIIGKDPLLLPLGKYGGPTLTHALGSGSPARDAGSCTDTRGDPVTVDQRGVARPQGEACDIGAFEGARAGVYLPLVLK